MCFGILELCRIWKMKTDIVLFGEMKTDIVPLVEAETDIVPFVKMEADIVPLILGMKKLILSHLYNGN